MSPVCNFCQRNLTEAPIEEMEQLGVAVYFCHPCLAEHLFFLDGSIALVNLYTAINGKYYRWTETPINTATLAYIEKIGIPGKKKNEGIQTLKHFNGKDGNTFPKLTPETVQERVKHWLLFI